MKYSQSIHDLSHIPERDKWNTKKPGNHQPLDSSVENNCFCAPMPNLLQYNTNPSTSPYINITNSTREFYRNQSSSHSIPSDLQLCGCYMKDIAKNTSQLSHFLNLTASHFTANLDMTASSSNAKTAAKISDITKSPEKTLNDLIRPRKLKLDKTLTKYKMHKSLPVSPVSEERRFVDFVEQKSGQENYLGRKSFSYFVDMDGKCDTDEGFKQICHDIEKFSEDFNKKYEQIEQNFDARIEITKPSNNEEEDTNFSSDSLEEYSFLSVGNKKSKNNIAPRRCMSNNEIYNYQDEYVEEIPKSESFYLNQNIKTSQDSILSDDNQLDDDFYGGKMKSYCNSMESILSNESDCKSAPLEILFTSQRRNYAQCDNLNTSSEVVHSQSLPKNISSQFDVEMSSSLPKNYHDFTYDRPAYDFQIDVKRSQSLYDPPKIIKAPMKTSQTQTDFATPQEIVAKKARGSEEFQKKLLKFECEIAANKKPVAFFIETKNKPKHNNTKENVPIKHGNSRNYSEKRDMHIPTLASKNKQYKSKFCNVLNNKPEFNVEIFESGHKNTNNYFTLSTVNFEKNTNKTQAQETSSLDRHLFTKSLLGTEKVCHKPPKAVRRHSSKTRKTKTSYEYIKKEDFYVSNKNNKCKDVLNNRKQDLVTDENTIELNYKEKNVEKDLETSNASNTILNELYDSLDKTIHTSKMDYDSLEVNLNTTDDTETKLYDSLEVNVFTRNSGVTKNTAMNLKNVLAKSKPPYYQDKIQYALENIKILNEIQRKIMKINNLVDIFKKNMYGGKVRALSSMYESMTNSQSYYNDLSKLHATPIKFRRRNLSLPSFVERRLNFDMKAGINISKDKCNTKLSLLPTNDNGTTATPEGELFFKHIFNMCFQHVTVKSSVVACCLYKKISS